LKYWSRLFHGSAKRLLLLSAHSYTERIALEDARLSHFSSRVMLSSSTFRASENCLVVAYQVGTFASYPRSVNSKRYQYVPTLPSFLGTRITLRSFPAGLLLPSFVP